MAKTLHTHQGTCQACGARQAVDNGSRLIAKHGYKVSGFGMFVGTCGGSGKQPAELDIAYTQHIMAQCEAWAVNSDRLAALYASGDLMVYTHSVDSGRRDAHSRRVYITVPMFGCSDAYVVDRERREAFLQENQAKNARAHAEALLTHVVPRYGQDLYAVAHKSAPRVFRAGEVVRLYDKDFRLLSPRFGYRGGSVKYWKGEFVGETTPFTGGRVIATPSIIVLRKQNPS